MKQIWKKINLYGKEYYVNNTGLIKNKYGRILKPYLSSGEYGYIKIVENGKHHHVRIHRIVADAFIPNINNLPQVNHKDGNKLNNCVNNLEWISASGNVKHGYTNNLYKRSKSRTTKVNQYDLNGNFIKKWNKIKDIEKEYNVSHTAIRFCCLNKIKSCAGYIWKYADK